jgi:hypothetical protein
MLEYGVILRLCSHRSLLILVWLVSPRGRGCHSVFLSTSPCHHHSRFRPVLPREETPAIKAADSNAYNHHNDSDELEGLEDLSSVEPLVGGGAG